jgi:hypothetical protein
MRVSRPTNLLAASILQADEPRADAPRRHRRAALAAFAFALVSATVFHSPASAAPLDAGATPPAASDVAETLAAMEGNTASIPVPATAQEVKFDGAEGKLAFETVSSLKSVVAFYRAQMKALGWQAEPSVIDKPNMAVLDFSKDGKEIELTAMRPIDKTEVDASGEGLVKEAEKAAAAPAPSAEDLAVEETGGFPIPSSHTMAEAETTPLRRALDVETQLDLKSVLNFYRQELAKRGWKEEADGVVAGDESATFKFTSPDGPAVLKLGRKDDATTVSLIVSNSAKAAASGMAAKPGKVRAMFGNLLSTPVIFTINKQTVKVAPGVGANGPGGPTLELPPGKYKVSMKSGELWVSDDVEVGADEIWGFMAGPGGLMPMQIH